MLPYAGKKLDSYIVCTDSAHKFSVDCANYMTLIVYGIRWNDVSLCWSESRFLWSIHWFCTIVFVDCASYMTLILYGIRWSDVILRWLESRFLYSIHWFRTNFLWTARATWPSLCMVSVEMMLLYAGQKLDSYIVSIDFAETFCGLRELHDPNCMWYPLRWCYLTLVRK